MLNYFNFKKFDNQYLLTNDFGRYVFLDEKDFILLIKDEIDYNSEIGSILIENLFIYSSSDQAFSSGKAYLLRDSKNYVLIPTSLHIFVVTTDCNMKCIYCQAKKEGSHCCAYMSIETAECAVDIALQSPAEFLAFEFQGGEPLLNYNVIKHIVKYSTKRKGDKKISFSIVSNLTLLNDEMITFIRENDISIATSLDGDMDLHNANRPLGDGTGSYLKVINSIYKLKKAGVKIGAIQTTTKNSIGKEKAIIESYCSIGFDNIFIRPLTQLGCAKIQWEKIGYSAEQFKAFYKSALQYIIRKNIDGVPIQEGFSTTVFSKLLHRYPVNYMELRSPCGASVGQLAYYTNGDVYTCDEGRMLSEMGNDCFKLGNVFENQFSDLISNKTCRTACLSSITESIPGCCDCVYQPFCGVCPVVNMAIYNDTLAKEPHNYRCKINEVLFDVIFDLLRVVDEDSFSVLKGWRN